MLRTSVINFVSKIGLAIPLLYLSLLSIFDQSKVVGFWPVTLSKHVNENALALITCLASGALIAWLFSNQYKFQAALTSLIGISLAGILNMFNFDLILTLTPLFCLALGLSLRYYPRVRVVAPTRVTIPKEHVIEHAEKEAEKNESEISPALKATVKTIVDEHDQHLFIPENK